MSRIKEELIGYERNPWYSEEWHEKINELTEHELYCMTVAEMQQKARTVIKHDWYNAAREDVIESYERMAGDYKDEQM